MKHITLAILISIFSTAPYYSHAAPDKYTQWLIDEPASLMDIGILSLKRRISLNHPDASINVIYKYYENEIEIIYVTSSAEKNCRSIIEEIRLNAGVYGGELTGMTNSYYSNHFMHSGYYKKYQPDKQFHNIDKIIMIDVIITPNELRSCRGKLISNDILYKE